MKNLGEIASVFFKLGLIAFGGPAAHIAMMQQEVVEKRKWISQQHFLDLVGATNLIPGPNSTEMTMHCGKERGGYLGLFVAGICFIFPAVVLTGILAYFYIEYGQLPAVEPFIYGIKPAVLAIILSALYKLGKKALKSWQLGVIGLLVISAVILGVSEVFAILGAGILGVIWSSVGGSLKSIVPLFIPLVVKPAITNITQAKIFFTFLKIGSVLFGGGYVLVAYLDGEIVQNLGWLTKSEILDAIAIGQFTPGPVLSTATFVGYQLDGVSGALLATAGIFLPSFFFVIILNPLIPLMSKSKATRAFLDAVNVGALGIMLFAAFNIGMDTLVDWKSIIIACISIAALFGIKKVNALWTVVGGSLLGYILYLI